MAKQKTCAACDYVLDDNAISVKIGGKAVEVCCEECARTLEAAHASASGMAAGSAAAAAAAPAAHGLPFRCQLRLDQRSQSRLVRRGQRSPPGPAALPAAPRRSRVGS